MSFENEITAPKIVSPELDAEFRSLCEKHGLDPDNKWIGHYVDYEWGQARHYLSEVFAANPEPRAFEFGCNVGASAIVLAHLGAHVTGCDIAPDLIQIANSNAARYGVSDCAELSVVTDSKDIPAADESFDCVICNSVLEYLDQDDFRAIQQELSRILKPGGFLYVLGTSNRIWPREIHSQKWFTNYLPRFTDNSFGTRMRGRFPREVLNGFPDLVNEDLADHCATYMEIKRKTGMTTIKLKILKLLAALTLPFGITPGLLTPSIVVRLRKPL